MNLHQSTFIIPGKGNVLKASMLGFGAGARRLEQVTYKGSGIKKTQRFSEPHGKQEVKGAVFQKYDKNYPIYC